MKRFILSLTAMIATVGLYADSWQLNTPQLAHRSGQPALDINENMESLSGITPMIEEAPAELRSRNASAAKAASRAEGSWSEWTQLCTGYFPAYNLANMRTMCEVYGAEMKEFKQPFQVMKRTCSDGTSQLQFKNVFNGVDLLLDVEANGMFSCHCPSGIMLPSPEEGWYNEFYIGMEGYYNTRYNENTCVLAVSQIWLMVDEKRGIPNGGFDMFFGNLSDWPSAGMVKVRDSAPMAGFSGVEPVEMTIEAWKHPFITGVYYFPDYYQKWAEAGGYSAYFNADDADLYFVNASDPNNVYVTNNPSGKSCWTGLATPPYNGRMKTGLNANPEYYTSCIMNYGDATGSRVGGKAVLDSNGKTSIQFGNASLCNLVYSAAEPNGAWIAFGWGETEFTMDDASTGIRNIDNWQLIGSATVTENILFNVIGDETVRTLKAEVRQSPVDQNIYALSNPYLNLSDSEVPAGIKNFGSFDPYIFINANNRSAVFPTMNYMGSYTSNCECWSGWAREESGIGAYPINLLMMSSAVANGIINDDGIGSPEEYFGTFTDDEIVMDRCFGSLIIQNSKRFKQPNANSIFRVKMTENSIEAISAEADVNTPVEYYNLQGVRVVNPHGGIFIRRQGSSVTKTYIP